MCNRKPFFSGIQQIALLVIREEIKERHLVGTDRDPVLKCKAFVKSVIALSWLCIVCIKYMEPSSFDSLAETDVVRRLPTSGKVFCIRLGLVSNP